MHAANPGPAFTLANVRPNERGKSLGKGTKALFIQVLIMEEDDRVFVEGMSDLGECRIVDVPNVHIENFRTDHAGKRLNANFAVSLEIEHDAPFPWR